MRIALAVILCLCSGNFLLAGTSLQQAWNDGFWQVLPDDDTSMASSPTNTQQEAPPPVNLLRSVKLHTSGPHPQFLHLDATSWIVTAAVAVGTALFTARRIYIWYNEPRRKRRRIARHRLRAWLRTPDTSLPQDFLHNLQTALDQPPGVNLLQLAHALQSRSPECAEALQQLEKARFDVQAIRHSHLKNVQNTLHRILLLCIFLTLTAYCWQLADNYAEQVDAESLHGQMQHLAQTQSSWQLSQNLTRLSQACGYPDAPAWEAHARHYQDAYRCHAPWIIRYLPECLLPLFFLILYIMGYTCFTNRNPRLLCGLATCAVLALGGLAYGLHPRFQLEQELVAKCSQLLLPIPDTSISPALALADIPCGAILQKNASQPLVNSCVFVQFQGISGWIPQKNALFYTFR